MSKGPSAPTAFNEEDISKINKLEQLFHTNYLTADLLHELVALYVRAIDIFTSQFTFMRSYFLDKMSFVLSRPQTIKLLEGGNENEVFGNLRQTLRITQKSRDDPAEDSPFQADSRMQLAQDNKLQEYHHHHYHYDDTKNKEKERNMRINMKMKVMREVEENMKNIKKEVDEADQKIQKNEEKVKVIEKGQDASLQQRLANRKKKLRKKSAEIKVNKIQENEEDEPEPVKKQQLIQAQRELTQAILKYTVRMTQKQINEEQKKQVKKGRIKINELSDEQEEEEKKPVANMKKVKQADLPEKPTGRVNTKRLLEDEEGSQYW